MRPPAFQFYVDNFIEGTSEMSPHEVGCYVRLLCHQWSRGQIPLSDPQKLRRVAGGVVSKDVLAKFPNGKNKRLEREREKQQVWREKSREGGIKSGLTRASRVLQPPLQPPLKPEAQPNANTPSSSSFPSSLLPVEQPTISMATSWLIQAQKAGADYTDAEMKHAFNAIAANGFMWGKNPIVDFRAALERQIQTDRNNSKSYGKNNSKPNPRNAGTVGNATEIASQTAEFVKRQQPKQTQSHE
jgi:uncharacterized protein YdaU (DUF1376 family)